MLYRAAADTDDVSAPAERGTESDEAHAVDRPGVAYPVRAIADGRAYSAPGRGGMIRRAPRTLRERRRRRRAIPLIRPATDLILRLHDGRRLGVAEFGSRSALPVIYLHGFIGSRLEPAAVEIEDTNIISFDRPGYGRTDLQRLPSLRAWGADVAEALGPARRRGLHPGRRLDRGALRTGRGRGSGQSRQAGDPGRRHRRAGGPGDCRRHGAGSVDDRPPRQPHRPARPPAA